MVSLSLFLCNILLIILNATVRAASKQRRNLELNLLFKEVIFFGRFFEIQTI